MERSMPTLTSWQKSHECLKTSFICTASFGVKNQEWRQFWDEVISPKITYLSACESNCSDFVDPSGGLPCWGSSLENGRCNNGECQATDCRQGFCPDCSELPKTRPHWSDSLVASMACIKKYKLFHSWLQSDVLHGLRYELSSLQA